MRHALYLVIASTKLIVFNRAGRLCSNSAACSAMQCRISVMVAQENKLSGNCCTSAVDTSFYIDAERCTRSELALQEIYTIVTICSHSVTYLACASCCTCSLL